jgi:hypothetical protein
MQGSITRKMVKLQKKSKVSISNGAFCILNLRFLIHVMYCLFQIYVRKYFDGLFNLEKMQYSVSIFGFSFLNIKTAIVIFNAYA